MTEKKKLDIRELLDSGIAKLQGLRRYSLIIFIVFVATLYGFLFFRITTLTNTQPTQDAVNNQIKAAQLPYIDKSLVDKINALQNNNVNVKTLFDQARSSPFQ